VTIVVDGVGSTDKMLVEVLGRVVREGEGTGVGSGVGSGVVSEGWTPWRGLVLVLGGQRERER
jgi:hypothetical protein